jgi:three-Cys-motif partner protein
MATEPSLQDDGLDTPEIGPWGEHKYRLAQGYARVFATSMKRKWRRVYIDLFSGSGRARIEGTQRIVPTSPFRALEIPDRFDRYIFCEKDPLKINALRARAQRDYKEADIHLVPGDVNAEVDEILKKFPTPRTKTTWLFALPIHSDSTTLSLRRFKIWHLDPLIS